MGEVQVTPEPGRIYCGDALTVMRQWPENCVDAMVTDPPAGIGFMGKAWDHNKGGRRQWIAWLDEIMAEGLRVLKPGGHAFVWALPRTSHWTGTALEDAGFEIRDCVYHVFGSGFPKSLDVSKGIDKGAGAEREVVGRHPDADKRTANHSWRAKEGRHDPPPTPDNDLTTSATRAAAEWEGWGTALKPAVECWWLCRKPLEGTVAQNVLKWGVGALNIDACRVGTDTVQINTLEKWSGFGQAKCPAYAPRQSAGRWPAHLIHDGSEEVIGVFPCLTAATSRTNASAEASARAMFGGGFAGPVYEDGSNRNAARFFYCAKASRSEREAGLENMVSREKEFGGQFQNERPHTREGYKYHGRARNHHPTVKPLALMEYLIRLITRKDHLVMDPFAGSGSTLIAAASLGRAWVGIELSAEYVKLAEQRLAEARGPLFAEAGMNQSREAGS